MSPHACETLSNRLPAEEKMLESVAQRVVEKRLASPVIFLLEMHKPLVPLFHAGGVAMAPFLSVLLGSYRTEALVEFLDSRGNVELLIQKIEELESGRGK